MSFQSTKLVVHVADIALSAETGMGRIACHWQQALEQRGYEFIHIGRDQVGRLPHRGLFGAAAYLAYRRLGRTATFFLVHEAAASGFVNRSIPAVVFSHGLDRRSWELGLARGDRLSLKSRLLFPLWRLRPCDRSIKRATTLLFSNTEDVAFAHSYYGRTPDDIFVFRNGADLVPLPPCQAKTFDPPPHPLTRGGSGSAPPLLRGVGGISDLGDMAERSDLRDVAGISSPRPDLAPITVGFIASWLPRKGTETLLRAADLLYQRGVRLRWLLAGTGGDATTICDFWRPDLQDALEIIPYFPASAELGILARCDLVVLPSFFEGQPLSLLQAMAAECCCIATDCCGQRDVIQHGENGLLFPVGQAERLADLIATCAHDADLRSRLGMGGWRSLQSRAWPEVAAEVVDRIELALGLDQTG